MSIEGNEALAGLQLLVAVAKADSDLTTDERSVIAEALDDAHLPDGITPRALIESSSDVDSLIAQIHAQDARDVAFAACLTMADSSGVRLPKRQAILDKIETAWAVPAEEKSRLGRVLAEARDTVWLTHLEPTADRVKRDALVKAAALRRSIRSAVFGLSPMPLVATDLAVVGLQAKKFNTTAVSRGDAENGTDGESLRVLRASA
jgi:hypothetical protein